MNRHLCFYLLHSHHRLYSSITGLLASPEPILLAASLTLSIQLAIRLYSRKRFMIMHYAIANPGNTGNHYHKIRTSFASSVSGAYSRRRFATCGRLVGLHFKLER